MSSFYEELRSLREEQGIDLEEIHNRTKINLNSLQAMEAGQFDILPTPYIRLFLKAYVIEIGADVDDTLNQLEHHLNLLEGEKSSNLKRNKHRKFSGISTDSNKKALPSNPDQSFQNKITKALPIIIIWIVLIFLLINYNLSRKEPDQSNQFEASATKEEAVFESSSVKNSSVDDDSEKSEDSEIDTEKEVQIEGEEKVQSE